MFNYALWPQAAYTTARWTGALCYVAFAVTVVYGMLGMAFGWFDGYGNDWWRSALRVAAAMCLVLELGTALDFLTDGKPGFKRRHPKWPALDAAHKRRHFLKYTISATVLMLAANVFVWLGLEAVLP
jgi:hypothetical protein